MVRTNSCGAFDFIGDRRLVNNVEINFLAQCLGPTLQRKLVAKRRRIRVRSPETADVDEAPQMSQIVDQSEPLTATNDTQRQTPTTSLHNLDQTPGWRIHHQGESRPGALPTTPAIRII